MVSECCHRTRSVGDRGVIANVEAKSHFAEFDDVSGAKYSGLHFDVVYDHSVHGIDVGYREHILRLPTNFGVVSRNSRIIQRELVLRMTADAKRVTRYRVLAPITIRTLQACNGAVLDQWQLLRAPATPCPGNSDDKKNRRDGEYDKPEHDVTVERCQLNAGRYI